MRFLPKIKETISFASKLYKKLNKLHKYLQWMLFKLFYSFIGNFKILFFLFTFSQRVLRYTYIAVKFPNRIKENVAILNILHKILKNPKINIETFIKIISKSVSFKENNIWKESEVQLWKEMEIFYFSFNKTRNAMMNYITRKR